MLVNAGQFQTETLPVAELQAAVAVSKAFGKA